MTAADVKIEVGEMTDRFVPSRLPASLLASAALHALGLVVAIHLVGVLAVPRELPRAEIIPVSLVSLPGGGGGPKGDGRPAPPPPAPAPIAAAEPIAPPPPAPVAKRVVRKPAPQAKTTANTDPVPTPVPPAPAGGGDGAVVSRGGSPGAGGGDGSGGDGSGGARPAYGSNPRPPYPLAARRLGLEGRVLLEVVVRADGRAASVTIRQSSGHDMLDTSAADTVRTRWRFIPARRAGVPVESTVTVPIRFRIHEG